MAVVEQRTRPIAEAPVAITFTPRLRFLRALLISLVLLPINAYWAADILVDVIFSLLVPPMCSLIVLAFLNIFLRRFARRWAFTSGELVLIYAFLSVATAICAEWMNITYPYTYSYAMFADQNPWNRENILPRLPDWFFFKDASQLQDFQRGGFGLSYALSHLYIFVKPLIAWTLLFGLVCSAMLCINTLMRDQWSRREKLAFPIIQVPMLLTRPDAPAWKSRYLWGAFAVMFAIDMLNGISFLYPSVPMIKVRFLADVNQWLPDPPWNAIGWTPVGIFPYMSAIAVFMPTDLLFSCIFFFFLRKAIQIIMLMYGYEQGVFGGGWLVPSPPYFSEQTWGAFFGLFVGAMLSARGYLRELWQHIKANTAPTPHEIRPRFALLGLILSLAGLAYIGLLSGLSPWLVIAYVGVFLIFSTALTRMRAQLGPPSHEMAFMGPHQLVLGFGANQMLSQADTVRIYHLFFIFNRIHRSHPMPYQLEAYKMGESVGVSARSLFWTMLIAIFAGVALGQIAYIYRGYLRGAPAAWGEIGNATRQIIEQPHPVNVAAILAVVTGFAVVMLLDAIRFQVPGFPLHPVGYALSMNFGVDYYWFGLIIVLIIKSFIQRYYGLKGYEKLRMVAIGIILAEFTAELIWSTITMSTQIATYSISINGRLGWQQ